jgi:hypothetical protein
VRLLGTPQWEALTTRQKNILLAIRSDGPLRFRLAQHDDIRALEKLGLLTADWGRRVASEPEER